VQYVNPTAGGKVYISNPKANNFAEFLVATSPTANIANSSYVQTGRQNASNYSSLYTSLITDTFWIANQGELEVPAVITSDTMTFDTIVGIVIHSFGTYKLLPRNNDDFKGANVNLEPAQLEPTPIPNDTTSTMELSFETPQNRFYPNPANEIVNFELANSGTHHLQIVDITGKTILSRNLMSQKGFFSVNELPKGVYIIDVVNVNTQIRQQNKLVITR
jgi:hypothetical protein